MWTKLHWVNGPWPGKLALASRPRGGEWIADEVAHWRHAGIDTVVSLLTAEEESALDLKDEATQAIANGIDFIAFPILDREVPDSESAFTQTLCRIDADLAAGRNVVLHCRQGIGRTGLVAAGLLLAKGYDPQAAVNLLSAARGIPVPETPDQRRWLDRYASQFAVVPRTAPATQLQSNQWRPAPPRPKSPSTNTWNWNALPRSRTNTAPVKSLQCRAARLLMLGFPSE